MKESPKFVSLIVKNQIKSLYWRSSDVKMALKKVKGNFERMFDKNLTDLVRGIRNNKDNEVSFWLVKSHTIDGGLREAMK